ncbi:MAG: fimbrillin family protein [Bacteroides sp.]|nr:fimbrillin family protein [Bacteroides sp.]MCM1389254.1 fimbrillin family protein [Bacteroides sp.]
MKSKTKLLSLASLATLMLVSCTNDELKEVYEGEEIAFTTRVGRATPTTLETLDGFRVYADADGYTDLFIKGDTVIKKKGTSGDYVFKDKKITWPVDVNIIKFWAYGPLDAKISPDINALHQNLNNFSVPSDMVNGGANHKDLVVANTEAVRNHTHGMQVKLEFHHALSQIEVNIKKGAGYEEGRVVRVKGAWLINVHSEGDLRFEQASMVNNPATVNNAAVNNISWQTRTPVNYGRNLGYTTKLGTGVHMISNNKIGGDNSSLMVLPQKYEYCTFGNDNDKQYPKYKVEEVEGVNNYNPAGTYILVLCRVETEHRFNATPDGSEENPAIGPLKNESGEIIEGHVHQLFPVIKDASDNLVYNENAYGYSCVPIQGEWLPGKKYVYTLEFCGSNSGAGVYPPEPLPDDIPEGIKRPDGKKPGDPVLDEPISFNVEVTEWEESSATTPMG